MRPGMLIEWLKDWIKWLSSVSQQASPFIYSNAQYILGARLCRDSSKNDS
jgi:hypothetical protein